MVDDKGTATEIPSRRSAFRQSHTDCAIIARLLIDTWTLTTGRTLRDVYPCELTEQELIDFWADD